MPTKETPKDKDIDILDICPTTRLTQHGPKEYVDYWRKVIGTNNPKARAQYMALCVSILGQSPRAKLIKERVKAVAAFSIAKGVDATTAYLHGLYGALLGNITTAIPQCSMIHYEMGTPIYVVGPRLAEMFNRTSLDAVRWTDIEIPYDMLYIALPNTNLALWGGERWHPLGGFYVYGQPDAPTGKVGSWTGTAQKGVMVVMWGIDDQTYGDDAVVQVPLSWDAGSLEKQANRKFNYINMDAGSKEVQQRNHETQVTAVRIALNALLYITAKLPLDETDQSRSLRRRREGLLAAARDKRAKKQTKLLRRAEALPAVSIIQLGRAVEQEEDSQGSGGTHASPRQHWVTGHWHSYRVGPNKAYSALKWVKPYLRGDPKRGTTDVRIYQGEV